MPLPPLVNDTNFGPNLSRIVSKIVDARGVDLFVPGILTWDVPLSRERSFYTSHGDLFAQLVAAAALVLVLCIGLRLRPH